MNEIIRLAEQHIRESESRLLHIDEVMKQSEQSHSDGMLAPDLEAQLQKIRSDRDGAAQELAAIRQQPVEDWSHVAKRGEKLKGVLETIGSQLEAALGAVFRA